MYKRFLICVFALALSACAVAPFDSTEYKLLTDIRFGATEYQEFCEVAQIYPLINDLYGRSRMLVMFTEYRSGNEESVKLYKKLNDEVKQLYSAYFDDIGKFPNPLYCKLKLTGIVENTEIIQKAIAKRK